MVRIAALLLMVIAPAGLSIQAAAGEHPWENKRIYYVQEAQGRLVEKGFFVRRTGSYQKAPCIVTEEERFYFSEHDDKNPTRSVRIRTQTTPEGVALQRSEEVVTGSPGRELITIEDGEARFDNSGSYGQSTRIPVPAGALFEVTGEWLAQISLRKGKIYEVDVIDRYSHSVVSETVEILGRLSAGDTEAPSVWVAEFRSMGRPPMQARFTSDGRLLRLESAGLAYQVVEREDYEAGRIPTRAASPPEPPPPQLQAGDDFQIPDTYARQPRDPSTDRRGNVAIPIGATVPAWDNFAWVILQAAPPGEWQSIILPSEYSQLEYNGAVTTITAMRNAPRVDTAARLPMAVPPDIQPYLTHTETIPSNNQSIIDAAYQAVSDSDARSGETNVLKAVSYLAGWINQTIQLQEWSGYGSTAVDTLNRRSGDSAGHARLFAAMARTLGIPSRVCQGFLATTGRAVQHCWAEAWISGGWVPVDTTVSRVGLPAGYVMAERSAGDGIFHVDFASFMRTPGLSLTLASAGRETPGGRLAELIIGDRRTYAYAEDDWMANLYWGFALRLPPTWTGSAKLNSVEMASPDRQASVKCEALPGDYRAGREELESNIASLRQNLSRFRLIDSRVVSFDPEGATPALFIDFTCQQDGMNLRCRQYIVPRRQRAFRISFWATANQFNNYTSAFDGILATFEF